MNDPNVLKTFRLPQTLLEELMQFAEMQKRPIDALVAEALESWLDQRYKEMAQKRLEDDNAQTNLSYDEFWDGVDI